MSVFVSKCLGNGTSDGQIHMSQVSIKKAAL